MEVKFAITMALMLTLLAAAQAQNTYIPYELGGDNYYTMYGSPELSASISGTDEFERGDTVTLYTDLTNYGRILGFKEDQTPQSPKEYASGGIRAAKGVLQAYSSGDHCYPQL